MFLTKKDIIGPLSNRLSEKLPGQKAHLLTKVKTKSLITFPNRPQNALPAAVLILLFPKQKDIHFFLTIRSSEVEHHKGQISLPGGAWEKGEPLVQTALRETKEEIGVNPDEIKILGSLTSFFAPVTGFMIHPYVGWADKEPATQINELEVKSIFTATIDELLSEKTFQSEQWMIRGNDATVPFFNFNGNRVWGVTATILSEFKFVLKDLIDNQYIS